MNSSTCQKSCWAILSFLKTLLNAAGRKDASEMLPPTGQSCVQHYKTESSMTQADCENSFRILTQQPLAHHKYPWLFAYSVHLTRMSCSVVFRPRDCVVGGPDESYRLDSDEPFIVGGGS